MKKNSLLIGFIVLMVLVVGFCIAGWVFLRPEKPVLQGEMEVTEVRVSSKVPGRVGHIYIAEGQQVVKGDTLAVLESPELEAKLEQARAVVAAAEAQSEKAVTGSRGEQIAGAYQLWQQARAGEMIAEKTYDRIRNLYDKEVVTAQQRDEAEARYMASAAASRAAEAQYNMALSGAREEDIEAARAQADQAHGALDEVESYLNETWIIAPVSGEVTAIYPHAGELVGTGTPVVSIADMSDMWVTLNVREDMLSGIETGDKLTLRIPALGDREAEFEVSYIKSLGSYATWRATKATSDFDAKTFEVRARPVSRVEGLRAGMSALFEIGR